MGKIRTRLIGLEEVEEKQKQAQKERAAQKKAPKSKIRAPGLKGGERMAEIEVKEEELAKMEKARKIIESKQISQKKITEASEKKPKKTKKTHLRGKKYQKAKKVIKQLLNNNQSHHSRTFSIEEAIKLLKKIKYAKFDESVELHLNVDKVGMKGEIDLPHSIGKTIRVKIVDEKILADIEKGKLDFDILISHPSFMPKLIKYAKILGPKGLMPNPKTGTISEKPEEVLKKFQKGILHWKTEPKFPLIHQMIGKISMDEKALVENSKKFLQSVGAKHIKSAFIKTTISPSLRIKIED